jgi:hypothetical protein
MVEVNACLWVVVCNYSDAVSLRNDSHKDWNRRYGLVKLLA